MLVALFALWPFCVRATFLTPQETASTLKGFVGKVYLLRGEGNRAEIRVARSALGIYPGQCDVALEIKRVEFAKSEVQIDAAIVGAAQLAGHTTNVCPNFPAATKIVIAGFTPRDSQQDLAAAVSKVLLQPDEYLASYNVTIASTPATSGDMETPLAQPGAPGLMPPKPILSVNANYTDAARRARLNGVITAQVTVGRDGHLYSGAILNSLDPALDQRVLSLLPLWRLQPARTGEDAVAFRVSLSTTFNLYR